MGIFQLAVLVLISAVGCQHSYSRQEALAEEFLRAAAAGESVDSIIVGDQPVKWIEAMRRNEPGFLQSASNDLQVKYGGEREGVTVVEFALQVLSSEESLGMQFVRRDSRWRIVYVQLSSRF